MQLCVVARDADLAGHVQRDFLQAVFLDDLINKRNHKIQARRQAGMEFPQSFNHPGLLLRHDLDGLDDEQDGDDHEDDSDFHEFSLSNGLSGVLKFFPVAGGSPPWPECGARPAREPGA